MASRDLPTWDHGLNVIPGTPQRRSLIVLRLIDTPSTPQANLGASAEAAASGVYDLLHRATKSYDEEARVIEELIRERCPDARSLLDVACGTGEHLSHLVESFDVAGIDSSEAMLRAAMSKLPSAPLRVADMRTFSLRRQFDAVVCLFGSVGYLPDVAALRLAVANMADHLSDGGVLIVEPWHHHDVWPADHVSAESVTDAGRSVSRVLTVSVSDDVSVLSMHYTVSDGGPIREFDELHHLRLFSIVDYVEAFEAAGLAVEHEPFGLSGRGIFIGRRPVLTR